MLLDDPYVFRAVVDALQIGIYVTDCERRIVYWNRGAEQITGFMRHEVLGLAGEDSGFLHYSAGGSALRGDECPLAESIRDGKRKEAELYLHHRAGHQVPVKVWTAPVRDARNLIIGAAECFEVHDSVAAQARHQSTLAAHGCLDFTTGLPNHGLTHSRLRETLVLYGEYHLPFGVICVQLDELPEFEEAHSLEAMNAILHVCAQTIAHVLGASSFLGRWAENQFLVIVPECDRVGLEKLRHEVHRAVNRTGIQWWGDPLTTRASVGWAMVERNDTLTSLVERVMQSLGQQSGQRPFRRDAQHGGQERPGKLS